MIPQSIALTIHTTRTRPPTGLWDTKLTWYSPCTTCWICLYVLQHGLKSTLLDISCYKIAEGFRFMPLSLGSAHGLVGCNIEAGVNAGARGRMEVSLRCHNSPRRYWVTGCGWRHAPEARGGCVRIWREKESGTRRQTRRIDFWGSQTRGELAPYGGHTRWGPNE